MDVKKIKIAIIGAGYWGKNLVRVFYSLRDIVDLKYVCDLDEKKLQYIKSWYPSVITTTDTKIIFNDSEINAAVIATQVGLHFSLAKEALLSGKNVLVEKPMTETREQAEELVALADEKNLILMVDHTFLYTGAVREIKNLIKNGEIGDVNYFDSERINLGLIQPDVNVIYDLAVHDISILNYLINEKPTAVSAFGKSYITKKTEELAHINLEYASGFTAHIHVSWLSPVKLRKTLIGGSKKMILYNDIEPSEKIKIYDKNVSMDYETETPQSPIYRSGDISIPRIDNIEALEFEANHFINCINRKERPLSDGKSGLRVIEILEACNRSIKEERKINL
ncbi:MAG: Gfo/Idh/MocA family oxidoreductase [Elusimicrobia bacterium]|nr:Gfo/Idh/MocA family oxidoreductase [Elusimicrobiota bacterium]